MKTAVIIGDSHVDPSGGMPFGKDLAALLRAQGYDVTQAGVGATDARMWASAFVAVGSPVCNNAGRCVDPRTLPQSPDLLVISLGTNDAANAAVGGLSVTSAVADVKKVIAAFAPKAWFWVGPPWMGDKIKGYLNDAMAQFYNAANSAGVPIFDSRPSTKASVQAGSGDGVHLGPQGGQIWADAVASAIASTGGSGSSWKPLAIAAGILLSAGGLAWYLRKRVRR